MRHFVLFVLACFAQQCTGARVHMTQKRVNASAVLSICEDAVGKPDVAACMCKSANSKGSATEIATECGKLRMKVLMATKKWSCAVIKKGGKTTCEPMCPWRAEQCGRPSSDKPKDGGKPTPEKPKDGPVVEERMHDDNPKTNNDDILEDELLDEEDDILEDDAMEDNVVVDEEDDGPGGNSGDGDGGNGGDADDGKTPKTPIPVKDFRKEAQKCISNPRDPANKKNEALCVCGLANGDGLSREELKDRCGKQLRMIMMIVKVFPYSCVIARTSTGSECTAMFPFRASKGNKDKDPVDVIVVEEKKNDEQQKKDDVEDELLEEDPENLEEDEEIKDPTPKCLSLSKTAQPGNLATQAQLRTWCGGDECGSKLKMRNWAICKLKDGQVEGPLHGGLIKEATNNGFDCYINCVADDAPNVQAGSLTADCTWSPGAWQGCSRSCGGGVEKQEVVVRIHPTGGGKPCPAPTERPCNTQPCPVDCRGFWGGFGGCSGSCGHNNGRQYAYYQITQHPKHGGAKCPRQRQKVQACTASHCPPPPDCFPADALVDTPSGPKTMFDLRVGDVVRSVDGSGKTIYDEVYFFGHADGSKSAEYINLKLSGTHKELQLSRKHFLPICPKHGEQCTWSEHIHVYAQEIKSGDYVWVTSAEQTALHAVVETSHLWKEGLYNPYTLSGKIVVNGVVTSAHSNWILDDWTPPSMSQYLPAVYQVLFLPGRLLYHFIGKSAADILDVNNPQFGANHGYAPQFLSVCLLSGLIIVVMASRDKRFK